MPSLVIHDAFSEFAIRLKASGNVAGADALHSAFEQRDTAGVQPQGHVRSQGHLARMTNQSKASDVGQRMGMRSCCRVNHLRRSFVQRGHRLDRGIDPCLLRHAFLDGRRDHARSERLS